MAELATQLATAITGNVDRLMVDVILNQLHDYDQIIFFELNGELQKIHDLFRRQNYGHNRHNCRNCGHNHQND